jgi:HEPN domain-containing protein
LPTDDRKIFKGYLRENDVPLIKTHDLIKLNDMTKGIKDLGIDEKKLIIITEVYIESRYPGDLGPLLDGIPTDEQAKVFIEYVKEIKAIINNELGK